MKGCGFNEPSKLLHPFVFGCYIAGPAFCIWRLSLDQSSIPATEPTDRKSRLLQEALVSNCASCDCHEGETKQQVLQALPKWLSPLRQQAQDLFELQAKGFDAHSCYLCNICGRWYHNVCCPRQLSTGECSEDCGRPRWNFVAQEIAVFDLHTKQGKDSHAFHFCPGF